MSDISRLGMGAMIGLLRGNEDSVKAFRAGVGKKITALKLEDNALCFTFDDGYQMKMSDEGQSCCEHRYMTTADDLRQFVGATLLGATIKQAPDVEDGGEAHEVEFLDVETSLGVFQMANHNEHNGYYGGFDLRVSGNPQPA
jgi:hypothetical protein